ncbi:T6SS immunity protein Tdi1 domain-containing protein [Cellulomonas sp. URHB0016]
MPTFSHFTTVAPIADDTIARFADQVPAPVVTAWREHGAGLVGDGYVRLLDPDHARQMLDGVVGMPEGTVPVLATALADLVFWIEPLFHIARFRWGVIETLHFDAALLFADVQKDEVLDGVLERGPYTQAVGRLGVPGIDECYGYVPLLALGGSSDPSHLDRGGLWEHLAVVMQLAGPPRPRQA